ncbi:MAG: hypothetical protein M1832_005731 [Thelocarpon impressellum]|nr:MAG: hypothetical protein M1832_005731 [Thelocarpon impressellum]
MGPLARRHRSSTAASTASIGAALTAELQPLIQLLQDISTPDDHDRPTITELRESAQVLNQIRRYLLDSAPPQQAKDAFRHLYGFQALLSVLRSVSGFYRPLELPAEGRASFFELLNATQAVLAEALRDQPGNRRYFARRVEGGGWAALEQALASTGVGGATAGDDAINAEGEDHLFGILIAFAVGDGKLVSVFEEIRRYLAEDAASQHSGASDSPDVFIDEIVRRARERCSSLIGDKERLKNPEIVPTLLSFWVSLHADGDKDRVSRTHGFVAVLVVLQHLADIAEHNLMAIHATGVLSFILPRVFDQSLPTLEASLLQTFAERLISLGISSLEDAKYLYRNSNTSPATAEFLLRALRSSKSPSHIQFDLALHGFSSVELPTLGRTFPPVTSSGGYTMAAWICIDMFDPASHTTIFGAFDSSQTCFLLAYLEKDTHNFILQTSVTSSRPSVRFKSISFKPNRWYHVTLVHHRPRTMSSSKAALFVDGEFLEQVKCQYPSPPPANPAVVDTFPSVASSIPKHSPVQVFLGTPQDLSSRLGKDVVRSRWSLASFHLFEDALSDDVVAVYFRLGPRYSGNFQDCLGSFQTYQASAALNLRNEYLHAGKEEKSDIVAAIRQKASGLLPESRILLNISPVTVMDDDDRNNIDESQLIRSLSKQAAHNLHHFTRSGANAIVVNSAIPAINDALTHSHGIGVLTGEPTVVVKLSLDDASWRIGGCAAVGLKMIEVARTREDVVRAVEILLESVKDNWRNSEAMERQNAFGILGALLRSKMDDRPSMATSDPGDIQTVDGGIEERHKLSFELLSLILGFVGYKHDRPEESVIVNPLAYRILLVDFDMWRKAAPVTQRQYYKQFVVFGTKSKYHQYNSKRLLRMRIVRRLLDALKSEVFSKETFPAFMDAFKSLVRCNLSTEVLRSLALFVTYALHKSDLPSVKTLRPKHSIMQIRRRRTDNLVSAGGIPSPPSELDPNQSGTKQELSRPLVGLKVLEMFSALLCDEQESATIKKFAKTVTNKWLLYILAEEESSVVVLGAKILARLLVVHGSNYVSKFALKSGGFVIMKQRLQRWWCIPGLWPILFAILFNRDVASCDFTQPFEPYSLLETFNADGKAKVIYPEVLPVITAMLGAGLKTVSKNQNEAEIASSRSNEANGSTHQLEMSRPKHGRRRSMSLNTELTSPRE